MRFFKAIAVLLVLLSSAPVFAQDDTNVGGIEMQEDATFKGRARKFNAGSGLDVTMSGRTATVTGDANESLCTILGRNIGVVDNRIFDDQDCDGTKDSGEAFLDADFTSPPGVFYVETSGDDTNNTTCQASKPCKYLDHVVPLAAQWHIDNCDWTNVFGECHEALILMGKGKHTLSAKLGTRTLTIPSGIHIFGRGKSETRIDVYPGYHECGIDFTDANVTMKDLAIQNMSLNPDQWGAICSRGGGHGAFYGLGLQTAWSDSTEKASLFGKYGVGNSTLGIHEHTWTYNIGDSEGGVQVITESFQYDTDTPFLQNMGRCGNGHPAIQRACREVTGATINDDCRNVCIESTDASEIGTNCTQNSDCNGSGSGGFCLDEATFPLGRHAICFGDSADMATDNNWFQAEAVAIKVATAQFCEPAEAVQTYNAGLACADNGDCLKTCAGAQYTDFGNPCSVDGNCSSNNCVTHNCAYGNKSSSYILGHYQNIFFTNNTEGGLCDGGANDGKSCYWRCGDGTNAGARVNKNTGAASCNTGSCETGKCEGSARNGFQCTANADCGTGGICRNIICSDVNNSGCLAWVDSYYCSGGSNAYYPCDEDADCPSASCVRPLTGFSIDTMKVCASGTYANLSCMTNADCSSNNTIACSAKAGLPADPGAAGNCQAVGSSTTVVDTETYDCPSGTCIAGGLYIQSNGDIAERTMQVDSTGDVFQNMAQGTPDFHIHFEQDGAEKINLDVCGSFFSLNLTDNVVPGFTSLTPICSAYTDSIITPGSVPSSPKDGQLYYKNSSSKWCYWETNIDPDAEICIIDELNDLPPSSGGTGLSTVGAYDILACNQGTACDASNESLSSVDVGTDELVGRSGSGVIDGFKLKSINVDATEASGTGKILRQEAPQLGTSGSLATVFDHPTATYGVASKGYVDGKNYDTKTVNFTSTGANPIATWLNDTGNTITITKFQCFTDTSTEDVRIKECTSTTPRCNGASGTYMETTTDCDSDGTVVDGTDMTIETGNYVSIQITSDNSSTVVGVAFTYYVN